MFRILAIVIFLWSFNGFSQNDIKIKYYKSTSHYLNNELSQDYVIPKRIKVVSKKLRRVYKLIDPETGKKSRKVEFPWAISVDSNIYYNLRYIHAMSTPELYVKPDITGRYCVIYANKKTLKLIYSFSTVDYNFGGLTDVFINESKKWGKNWVNENDEKIKIFIVDTKKLEFYHNGGFQDASWKILHWENINTILDLNLTDEEAKDISLEEIKKIISKKNNAG